MLEIDCEVLQCSLVDNNVSIVSEVSGEGFRVCTEGNGRPRESWEGVEISVMLWVEDGISRVVWVHGNVPSVP